MSLGRIRSLLFGSVRRQLIVGVAGVHAVMMSLFVWDLTQRQQAMLLDQQTRQATALAQSVATSAATWLAARDLTGVQEIIEAQRRYPELLYAMAIDMDGAILAHTDRALLGRYVQDLPQQVRLTVLQRSPALVDAVSPALVAGRQVGWVRVGVGQHGTGLQLREITRDGLLYALAAILIGAALAYVMGTRLTRKLYAIQSVADGIQSGQTRLRAAVAGEDEAARLARQFNGMLDTLVQRERELAVSYEALHNSEAQVRRLNAELEQRVSARTAQLEATIRELESFAYSVSHDLRGPLRGIDGFSQVLLEDYGDRLDATGRSYLERVRAGSLRMGSLIDDLLMLSRVTRAPLTIESVDLSHLAADILGHLQKIEPGRSTDIAIAPDIVVQGDRKLLQAALENLLGNAWKYSAKTAQPRIEFGATDQEGEAVYFVRDNGVGFDMRYADKLFGTFERLHHRDEFEGTGIGLAAVQP
ncbi:MAG: HAMP domain-containing protein, partial [Hydrogenophilaceae bacterium]|nr:HAMP domain-containing protein [Hydrogenophilaceae bacterium]